MKKKTVMLVAAIAMILCLAVGGTLAYFTDTTKTATNTFTMGNVKIELDEAKVVADNNGEYTATEERVTKNTYENLYPGQVVPKDPTVYNNGSQDAFVRINVEITDFNAAGLLFNDAEGTFPNVKFADVFGDYVADNWTVTNNLKDAMFGKKPMTFTFTLKEKLVANDEVTLFKTVAIPASLDNVEANLLSGMNMNITAEAIQAAGFGSAAEAFAAFDAE